MKNILLCGANGFLGNYLGSEFSKDKYFVINFARQKNKYKNKNFYIVNFDNPSSIEKKLRLIKKI